MFVCMYVCKCEWSLCSPKLVMRSNNFMETVMLCCEVLHVISLSFSLLKYAELASERQFE